MHPLLAVGAIERWRRPTVALAVVLSLGYGAGCGQTASHSSLPRATRSSLPSATTSGLPLGTLLFGPSRVALHVEIAETDAARQHGLMDRATLASDSGMVFLFALPVHLSFYMKDTLIPLSIAFWDRSLRIVTILDMAPCRTDTCPLYSAGQDYVGAAEANRGFFGEHGIEVGDLVELER
jgi:uncharacterized membrane protein (UPF0127 family)